MVGANSMRCMRYFSGGRAVVGFSLGLIELILSLDSSGKPSDLSLFFFFMACLFQIKSDDAFGFLKQFNIRVGFIKSVAMILALFMIVRASYAYFELYLCSKWR